MAGNKMRKYWLLFFLGLPFWIPAFWGVFQYDDWKFLAMPEVTGDTQALLGIARNTFDVGVETVRPLAIGTIALSYFLFGENPMGWIFFNILIHFASACMVYCIARKLLSQGNGCHAEIMSFLVALLFFVSPITPYAVTYITQSRMEGLAAFFVLLSLWLYMDGRKILWIVPCILGCLCKETAFITPLIIFFYAVCMENLSWRRSLAILTALTALFTVGIGYNHCLRWAVFGNDWSLSHGLLGQMQGWIALDVLAEYTKRIIWPHPSWLNIDPDYVAYQNWVPFTCTAVLAVLYLVYKMREQRRVLAFSLLCFLAVMIVPIMILPIKPDDKLVIYKAYLACVPVYIVLTVCVQRLLEDLLAPAALVCVALMFGIWTYGVNDSFTSQTALWKDAAHENPLRIRPQYNLASAMWLEDKGDRQAYEQYEKVIEIVKCRERANLGKTVIENQCVVKTYYNMGLLLRQHGDIYGAVDCFVRIRSLPQAKDRLREIEKVMARGT